MMQSGAPDIALGFDFGTKRIGVAVAQSLSPVAQPLTVLPNRQGVADWEGIAKLVNEWRPTVFIVGVPLHMDGGEQNTTHLARKFANELNRRFARPVIEVDERLTTRESKRQIQENLIQGDRRRAKRQSQQIDSFAAKVILEAWLAQKTSCPP